MTMRFPNLVPAARAAAAALLLALLAGCLQDSPEKLMASAREHLAKGDRSTAVIQLRNVLKEKPDNGEARLMLGEILLDLGEFASAEKELARALELEQPLEKALPAYTTALLAQGKYQAVIAAVEQRRLYSPPAVAATQSARGEAYLRLGNRDSAREAFAAALSASPGFPRARLGQLTMAAADGQTDEALKGVEEIIVADPKLGEARLFRARLLLARGDRDGARKGLEEAVAVNERDLPARLALIGLLTETRDYDAAAKLIESTRKVAPGDLRVAYLDAALALRRGDRDRARQQVEQVLKHAPDHVPSLVLAGALALQAKQLTEAEASLRKAIGRAPNHAGARQLLVQTYLAMGQPAKAKDTLQPLLEEGLPEEPRLLLLAGETYLASGDARRATAFYQAAAKAQKSGSEAAARMRLGEIALATGKVDEGFRELEAAAELGGDDYQADLALITLYLRRKEFDKAVEAVKALEKKQPDNPLTYQMYGALGLAKGDLAAARKGFEKALALRPTYLPAAYELAQLDLLAKKPEEARKRFEAMIAKEPGNEQVYIALAELLARTDAPQQEVAATLQRGIAANPQAAGIRLALINYQLRVGESKAALAAAQEAASALPSDPRVLDAAGVAQEAAGEINQAVETYRKQAALQPQSPRPLYRLAGLYMRQKQTDEAIEALRRAQKISPRPNEVVPQLAQVYLAADRVDDALKEARALQKREPRYAGGWKLEGDIELARRMFGDAERLYREALKLDPSSGATAAKLHTALIGAGKRGEADALARAWLAQHPKDATMRLYLGDREQSAGNLKAAAAHYQAAIAIEPKSVVALNNLAWVGAELGDPKALGYAEQALLLAPENATVLDTYGWVLLRKGETEKGLAAMNRARTLAPTRSDLRLSYAKALIRAGKKDEARRELEALQGVKGNFPGKDEVAVLVKKL